jgi:hypothetical protein
MSKGLNLLHGNGIKFYKILEKSSNLIGDLLVDVKKFFTTNGIQNARSKKYILKFQLSTHMAQK